jgi:hypothetical protein
MLNDKMDSFNVQEILSQLLLEYYNKVSVSQAPILTGAVLPPLDGQLHPLPGPRRILHEMVHVLTSSTALIAQSRNLILTYISHKTEVSKLHEPQYPTGAKYVLQEDNPAGLHSLVCGGGGCKGRLYKE